MKNDRLLAITLFLINRERISSKELARHFEVSERTIYRDLETINRAGIPVVAYPGKNGGFGILDQYKIDKNILSAKELNSIISALKTFNTVIQDKKIIELIEKFKSLLPKKLFAKDNPSDNNYLFIHFKPYGKNGGPELDRIKKSIEENKVLHIRYLSSQGIETTRNIEPMALISYGVTWYIYGYCLLRNDYRLFRLSRIRQLEMTQKIFTKKNIDLEKRPWESEWENRNFIELKLKFNRKAMVKVEDYFETTQISYLDNHDIQVSVKFPVDDWLYGFLLSFGDDLEVISPLEVRNTMREKIAIIHRIYH